MEAHTCHCSPGDGETVELAWCTQDDSVSIKWNEMKHNNNPMRKSKFYLTSAVSERTDGRISAGGLIRKSSQTRVKVSALEDERPSLVRKEETVWKQKWVHRKSLWSAEQDLFSWQFSLQPWSSDGSGQLPLGLEMFLTGLRLPVPALCGQ